MDEDVLRENLLDIVYQVNESYGTEKLEDPTCRWTTLLANSADKDLPEDVAATVQERGWSSPIWYGQ